MGSLALKEIDFYVTGNNTILLFSSNNNKTRMIIILHNITLLIE